MFTEQGGTLNRTGGERDETFVGRGVEHVYQIYKVSFGYLTINDSDGFHLSEDMSPTLNSLFLCVDKEKGKKKYFTSGSLTDTPLQLFPPTPRAKYTFIRSVFSVLL